MKIQKLWLAASLFAMGSTLAHASSLANPLLAVTNVPEPTSAMLGAGLVLVGLGLVRRRQRNK